MSVLLPLLLPLLFLAPPAHAESDGGAGAVSSLTTLTSSSSSYAYWHAKIVIGGVAFYTGGRACSGVGELSETDLLVLDTAMHESLLVNPWYQPSGSYLCLTTFRIYG